MCLTLSRLGVAVVSPFEDLMEGVRPLLRRTHSCIAFCNDFRKLSNLPQLTRGLRVKNTELCGDG